MSLPAPELEDTLVTANERQLEGVWIVRCRGIDGLRVLLGAHRLHVATELAIVRPPGTMSIIFANA